MNKGQGLIEMVFAVGVVGLVLTGVIALIIKSSGNQTDSSARDKAVTLSKTVMEEMVGQSQNDPATFWGRTDGSTIDCPSVDGFDGYNCTILFDLDTDDSCAVVAARNVCYNVTVTVDWKDGGEEVRFNRFFSR